ncbi:inactive transglutaminase family protein [Aestuariirhabdus sp. Z084]|uniref:inactive transglutaminase family protein n=1 Tax=Aestuariirhabdus haliotis TaxID=2918751 RepID=UPI00201B3FD5|nr:inactive transglutaminase family protein [Aestuariirhabdus haliotis]MCL6416460.1 inactive transglutaminase family protein [Aestuariirhabdus haliotis]MCL6420450.1 inactive transglutaminase family protein [Aestuariirhabdus haliotis]
MSARVQVYLLAFICISLGLGLTAYKKIELGFPLLPGEQRSVWTVEAKVVFNAEDKPVKVSLALPDSDPNDIVISQDFASPGYGFGWDSEGVQRRAEWARRNATGPQTLFYRLQLFHAPVRTPLEASTPPEVIDFSHLDESTRIAADSLVTHITERSADAKSFANELVRLLNNPQSNMDMSLLLNTENNSSMGQKVAIMMVVLNRAKIPARIARGLHLEDGRKRQTLTELIELYADPHWILLDPETGDTGTPDNFLLWQRGGVSLLDVEGGSNSRVTFSIIENSRPAKALAVALGEDTKAALVDFSIYSLPTEIQNTFKHILLIPIGALVVVLLRILVGIKTSGTFMPILIALALIQTTLFVGLAIFLTIVSVGLWIRSYLSHLNLLLVARISSVVIVVIIIMAIMSVLSNKLGLSQALTVTFFPMIILAWTIERMSILWEEDGPKEVLIQGGGSLLVAVMAYLAMTNTLVEHLTFNFPELLLVLLGIIMLIGQYTGYRLTELRRFQAMVKEH